MLCLSICLLPVFTLVIQGYAIPSVSYQLFKLNGYGGWQNDILGIFRLDAVGSPDVVRVEFYLDDQLVLNDTELPFQWMFNTADFSLGHHTFNITAYDGAGESASITFEKIFIAEIPLSFIIIMVILVSIPIIALVGNFLISIRREKPEKKG